MDKSSAESDSPQIPGKEPDGVSAEPAGRGSLEETTEQGIPRVVAPAEVADSYPRDQIFPLWRQRLRLAALVLFAGFAVFLIQRMVQAFLGARFASAAEEFLFWCHAAVVAILGLFSLLLCSRRSNSFFRLCTAEIALFGLPAAIFLASQHFITLRAAREWGIFSFSTVPLRLASYLGLVVSILSMTGVLYAFYIKLFTVGVIPGWAAQWIGTLFLGGVQLLSLGVIGEYVGRIYGEVKRRPLYVEKERVGFGPTA